jgi:hypothetical protein
MTTCALPVLFLDIDDVLCLNERFGGLEVRLALAGHMSRPEQVLHQAFNREACAVLIQLHDAMRGQLRYVISSTWRESFSRADMVRVFESNGLSCVTEALHPVWHTPIGLWRQSRDADISQWLDLNHGGEPFAVLDDTFSGAMFKPSLANPRDAFHGRVVLCQESVGLKPEHLEPLLHALRTPPVRPWGELR